MSVLLMRKRVCAAKIEVTPGTPIALANADGNENFFNPQWLGEIPSFMRQGQLSLSALVSVPGAQSAKVNVRTELYNNGTANMPFWASVLAPACGFTGSTGTLTLQTGNTNTITFGHYVAGNLYELAGAQGNLKIVGDKVGEPLKLDWEFTGLFVPPTATALIAPTFPLLTGGPPRFAGAIMTLGSVSPFVVSKFELDLGNKVTLREIVNAGTANTSGYIGSIIADREVKLNLTVEVPAIGTYDYFSDLLAANQAAFSCQVGNAANSTVTITAPKMQLRTSPKLADKDGIFTYDLEYGLNRSTSAGDDELQIVLS